MKSPMRSAFRQPSGVRRTHDDRLLQQDVAAMISETDRVVGREAEELAHDIIVVVRERVLREIAGYARENIR